MRPCRAIAESGGVQFQTLRVTERQAAQVLGKRMGFLERRH